MARQLANGQEVCTCKKDDSKLGKCPIVVSVSYGLSCDEKVQVCQRCGYIKSGACKHFDMEASHA